MFYRTYIVKLPRLSLTCPYTGVYSAALPGKKAAGCLSDQAG